jgi:uncharacterized protein
MGFWQGEKESRENRVSFEEAVTVFADPLARIFDDDAHSGDDRREIIVGNSSEPRLLLVAFVETEGGIRLLSARKATRRERKDYEEGIKT